MYAFLCNGDRKVLLGTDGVFKIDGRMCTYNKIEVVREYRERFKKNFKHKYDHWTHVFFSPVIHTCSSKDSCYTLYKL